MPKSNPYWTKWGGDSKAIHLIDKEESNCSVLVQQDYENNVQVVFRIGRDAKILFTSKEEFAAFLIMCQAELLDSWENY